GFLHLVNNILYKGLLFMVAGVIIYTTGRERLSQLGGLAKKLPFTAGAGLLASLAIAGFPFLNGYISKLMLKKTVLNYDLYTVKYGLSLAGIGTSLSFIKFMYYTFWHQNETSLLRKPKKSMQLGMSLLILLILIISFSPFLIENYFSLNSGIKYFSPASLWGGLQPILIAAVIFILLKRYLLKFQNIQSGKDIYYSLATAFTTAGKRLSSFHTGDLIRYLLWLLSFLLFLWLNFTVLNR
ncbi:MAG: proton-conducting transporter membrane subunit, partial [Halanaerobiaceae bacterium]